MSFLVGKPYRQFTTNKSFFTEESGKKLKEKTNVPSSMKRKSLFSFVIRLALLALFYSLFLMLGSETLETLVRKIVLSLGNQALSNLLLKTSCSVGLSSILVFVVRMAFLATEDTTAFMSKNMMDNHSGWTSIFGTSSGGNSVGSSEASVNQPAPDSPEPVAPEVDQPDGGGPLIPELANHLIPIEERLRELGHRLSINSICKNQGMGQHHSCAGSCRREDRSRFGSRWL